MRNIQEVINNVNTILPDLTKKRFENLHEVLNTVIARLAAYESVDDIVVPPVDDIPDSVFNNIVTLRAELAILSRVASYSAPEAPNTTKEWDQLNKTLYRYMPPVNGLYPWAQAVSDVVNNSAGTLLG